MLNKKILASIFAAMSFFVSFLSLAGEDVQVLAATGGAWVKVLDEDGTPLQGVKVNGSYKTNKHGRVFVYNTFENSNINIKVELDDSRVIEKRVLAIRH